MSAYTGPVFDADTHIVEQNFDFLKEYLPKPLHADWLLSAKVGPTGKYGLHIGDRLLENYDFREGLVPPPGQLKAWLRAMKDGREIDDGWVPATKDMYDRDAKIAKLDQFGVEGTILFVGNFNASIAYYPEDATGMTVVHAYNEYLNNHWGFAYKNRIYTSGVLALWDTELAVKEADWLIERGVRIIVMPMGPAQYKSLAHPDFDAVWSRLNEAGVVLAFHLQEARFMHPLLKVWGEKPLQPRLNGQTAWQWQFAYGSLPAQMTLANIVFHNFFERFPNIKVACVENGSTWLPQFLIDMDKARGAAKNGYWPCGQLKERPSKIFKEHCYVVTYPEEPVKEIVDKIGTSKCLLMGSDYPHAEGVAEPRQFAEEALQGLGPQEVQAIMHDNGRALLPV
jgi:predicted TIM-barrel fold metal-dependent hydrolase